MCCVPPSAGSLFSTSKDTDVCSIFYVSPILSVCVLYFSESLNSDGHQLCVVLLCGSESVLCYRWFIYVLAMEIQLSREVKLESLSPV